MFTVLCEQYQPSLRRDPMYNEVRAQGWGGRRGPQGLGLPAPEPAASALQYLDRIGQLFFGVPPKQTSSYGGLLGKLGRPCHAHCSPGSVWGHHLPRQGQCGPSCRSDFLLFQMFLNFFLLVGNYILE